ncbi:MAG: N-6 DNA methylase [Opitutaceae bacterium]|nr:N-6 DNA methylase [Opitutaceae bacterium]MBP9912481.1 N-6 DNA methylase [Opitutaceae bacterium]
MAPPESPATFETFQAELARLVAQFDRQHPTYTAPDYNEQTLRADFLDAFFRALGWDVGNQKGLIHTEREVDIEVRTTMSGRQTRADYVFRLNRTERFTCEAKKPAEVLHNRHIFQAKRDAFARGVPLAILSDFEEMKLYIVGARPHLDDPHTGEWKVLHFRQYHDAARELWDLLGYDNVRTGSIDRLIDSLPKRPLRLKGRQGWLIKPDRTRALDADFLNFLDDVRQQLGSDLLKHNDRADLLEGHRLNEAAQRIIDRLVFLRICEDRGIDTGTLLQTLFDGWYRQQPDPAKPKLRKPGKQTHLRFGGALEEEPSAAGYAAKARTEGGLYRELTEHIRALDQRPPSYKPFFNGQLFKPHFSEELTVGDEWLANFLLDLVDDDTGYNFADIKVEILGDAYERFLGKILRPQGRGATIEEKPEVRKAGGVYYTPRYITDYIVEQTVGRIVEGKSPKQVEKLKIVDPACGSGSFLLRAYERMMEHHLRWFMANPDKRRKEDCYVDAAGNVRLTTALKRRILESNIYGVDIDAQAVEVTQLSLYLKMLEGENRETLRLQTELFKKEPLLPPLDHNIKCFNSLIASDFSLDPAELVRVNAGDWDVQFPEIMQAGGFDAVVGNPPYVRPHNISSEEKEYFWAHFPTFTHKSDLYCCFMEQCTKLLRPGGRFSYIVSHGWLRLNSFQELRAFILKNYIVSQLVELPFRVFDQAQVDTGIFVFEKGKASASHAMDVIQASPTSGNATFSLKSRIPQSEFTKTFQNVFDLSISPETEAVKERMREGVPIGNGFDICFGLKTADDDKFLHHEKGLHKEDRPLLRGDDIKRYDKEYKREYVWYAPDRMRKNKKTARPGEPRRFEQPKVLVKDTSKDFGCTYDGENYYVKDVLIVVPREDVPASYPLKFVCGVLNSRLMKFYYRTTFPTLHVQNEELASLPLPKTGKNARPQHDRLVALVDKMLTLTPALRAAKSDAEKTTLQNALTKTDREIDQLVYQLYGLTPEEIALVEGAGSPTPAVAAD